MNKRYTSYEIKELLCNECRSLLLENLRMLNYFKTIEYNSIDNTLYLESLNDVSVDELNQIVTAILYVSRCPKHQLPEEKEITEEFLFEGVDCPNCALKIEKALNKRKAPTTVGALFLQFKFLCKFWGEWLNNKKLIH